MFKNYVRAVRVSRRFQENAFSKIRTGDINLPFIVRVPKNIIAGTLVFENTLASKNFQYIRGVEKFGVSAENLTEGTRDYFTIWPSLLKPSTKNIFSPKGRFQVGGALYEKSLYKWESLYKSEPISKKPTKDELQASKTKMPFRPKHNMQNVLSLY